MKEKYENLDMEIIAFDAEDVITTSENGSESGSGYTEGGDED